jgi:outer membrane protein OmpA-like peptidoglycan-associated protein
MWKVERLNKPSALVMAVVFLLAAIGCAPLQKTLVVVVPEKDGKVGTVAVTTPRGETLIKTPYAAVRVEKDGPLESLTLTEQDVRAMFGDALAMRPDPPLSFTLYFMEGKDELTPESRQRLSDVLTEISRRSSVISEVTVVGHTDRVGRVEQNDRLSLQRAQKVVADLVQIGIRMEIISVAGRGEREPLVPTADEVSESLNRRVEVRIR